MEGFFHDARDGTVGSQFGGGERHHDEAQEKKDRTAQRAAIEAVRGDRDDEECPGHCLWPTENHAELFEDEKSCEGRAEDAEFGEHLAIGGAGGDSFVHREFRPEKHQHVNDGRYRNEVNEDAPVGGNHRAEEDRDKPAHDKASWPTGVKDVQPFRLLTAEKSGDDGIDEGFHSAIAQAEDDRARVEQVPCGRARGGQSLTVQGSPCRVEQSIGLKSQHGIDGIAHEAKHHRYSVAHAVDHETEKDDRNGKRPDASAEEFLGFDLVQAEVCRPERGVIDEERPGNEGERGGDEGDEAPPEELLVFIRI